MSNTPQTFENFEQYWPHFLSSHRKASTRWAHVAAVGAGLTGFAFALGRRSVWPGIVGVVAASALANRAHAVFEGHTPENTAANPGKPHWAARSFLRLCVRTITGEIEDDLQRLEPTA